MALGVVGGLLLGKTLGVLLATWLAIRTGLAILPIRTTWRHIFGIAICAGVGFTVALFVSDLAFIDPNLGESAKLGILVGSTLAGVLGFVVLRTGRVVSNQPPGG